MPYKPPNAKGRRKLDPTQPRPHETIGGGFFVMRRDAKTGRIKPATWPFEYAEPTAAMQQAHKLASENPDTRFDIAQVIWSYPNPEDAPA